MGFVKGFVINKYLSLSQFFFKKTCFGFVIMVCHLWARCPYWQIPPISDNSKSSKKNCKWNYLPSYWRMRGLFIDQVTSSGPITRIPECKGDKPIFHYGRVVNICLIKLMTNPIWFLSPRFVINGQYPHIDIYWGLSCMGYLSPRGKYLYFILVMLQIFFWLN